MSSEVASSSVREKKPKKEKKDKKERKRSNDADTDDRIAKKLKSLAVTEDDAAAGEKKRKKKKHREKNGDPIVKAEAVGEDDSKILNRVDESRSKKSKKEKRRKHHRDAVETDATAALTVPASPGARLASRSPPLQTAPIDILQPSDAPEKPKFPLFSRKIKEYVPIFPVGFGNALEFAKSYHLGRRLNNFVPDFGGVMLSYKNAALSEYRDELSEGPLLGANIGEYGASFVWLHVEVGLFMPRRNAWMEGRVNLQDHEHIGIVCWKKFNAFIEARRLPSGWKWVDETSDQMDVDTEGNGEEAGHQKQQHGGHWVDEKEEPIQGRLIRFRIKNFDADASEDHSFLSIEGTMLAQEDEKKLIVEEEQQFARRHGLTLADWGVTRMGKKDEEER